MADLFLGRTMTEAFQFKSFGTAHTFTWDFPPDRVIFYNLTKWAATRGNIPKSYWFNGYTAAGTAYQEQVVQENNAGGAFNFLLAPTNGFTVANTTGGVPSFRASISAVSLANPCVVTTTSAPGFQTDQIVRITDLGDQMLVPRGMSELDGNRYSIVALTTTTFALYDPITLEAIDSTSFEPYVSGGSVNVESRVISLNNPQQSPYLTTPYQPNPFEYNPITYELTAGTSVMGSSGDQFWIDVLKYGQVKNLGSFTS